MRPLLQLSLLLETLSSNGRLARRVQRLEIRSYPPPQMLTTSLAARTLLAFLALPNLTSFAFTRDHSLSPQLLHAVATCMPALQELEINAHSTGSFDPVSLLQIKGPLVKLSLLMPDRRVVGVLEEWLRAIHEDGVRAGRERPGLHELTILSKVRRSSTCPPEVGLLTETRAVLAARQRLSSARARAERAASSFSQPHRQHASHCGRHLGNAADRCRLDEDRRRNWK